MRSCRSTLLITALACLIALAWGCGRSQSSKTDAEAGGKGGNGRASALGLADAPTVTFALPHGAIDVFPQMGAVAYNVPMVPLGAIDQPQSPTAVAIEPPVPLELRWLGTTTLGFWPQSPLHGSTEYTVRVAALGSIGGKLAAPTSWTFRTPTPQLRMSLPADGAAQIAPQAELVLEFDQPLDVNVLSQLSHLEGGDVASIAVTFRQPDERDVQRLTEILRVPLSAERRARVVVGKPARVLPGDADMALIVAPGLRSLEGPLVSSQPLRIGFKTLGPLQLVQAGCGESCEVDSWSPVRLQFNNELSPESIAAAPRLATLTPPVAGVEVRCWGSNCTFSQTAKPVAGGGFRVGVPYTLTVRPGWRDIYGQRWNETKKVSFTLQPPRPKVGISLLSGEGSGILERDMAPHRTGISAQEVRDLRASYKRMQPKDLVAYIDQRLITPDAHVQHPQGAAPVVLPAVATMDGDIALVGVPQQVEQWKQMVDLDPLLGPTAAAPSRTGALLVSFSATARMADPASLAQPGQEPTAIAASSLFQITDLHLTAKVGKQSSLLWVTSFSTGKPQAGAEVLVLDGKGDEVWRGKTNEQGLATAPGGLDAGLPRPYWYYESSATEAIPPASARRYVVARLGDDWTLLSPSETEVLPADYGEACRSQFGIFLDRNLYRLGDTVHVKGIVRRVGGRGLELAPAGERIQVRLVAPNGDKLPIVETVLSATGSFHADLPIGVAYGHGGYNVTAEYAGCTTTEYFDVMVFRTPKFSIAARAVQPHVVAGEALQVQVDAAYYSGGPLAQARVSGSLARGEGTFEPPGWKDYSFTDGLGREEHAEAAEGLAAEVSATLDAQGRATLVLPTSQVRAGQALPVRVDITVEDPTGQPVHIDAEAMVHPGTAYAGVHLDGVHLQDGQLVTAQMLAADRSGKLDQGARLEARWLRVRYNTTRQAGIGGELYPQTTTVFTPVATCRATQAAAPLPCPFRPRGAGRYAIEVVATDSQGRSTKSSRYIEVYDKPGKRTAEWGAEPVEADSPMLIPDKEKYRLGETAHVVLKNRMPGAMAWITRERDGVLHSELREVAGSSTTIDVPIDDQAAPNLFVCASLFDRRRAIPEPDKEDIGGPQLQSECALLEVVADGTALKVEVQPLQPRYRPGDQAKVEVRLSDATGKPVAGEVTLWAVDEGVLALSHYALPDLTPHIWRQAPHGVSTHATIHQLIRGRMSELKGGQGGGGGGSMRSNFRDVAVWLPAMTVGADGKAVAEFKLPENLTTYRLMAVATAGARQSGGGEAKLRIDRPLMLLTTWPRKVHVGDTFEAALVLRNRSEATQQGTISLRVGAGSGAVRVDGADGRRFELAAGASQEVTFRVHADRVGKIELAASADAGAEKDGVIETVEIVDPAPLQQVSTYGMSGGDVQELFEKATAARRGTGALQVTATATALGSVLPAVTWLMSYPYDCTEQLASRLVGHVWHARLAKRFQLPATEGAKTDEQAISAAIDALLARRTVSGNGGFALWPDTEELSPVATAWALRALMMARAEGHTVDSEIVQASATWLRRRLNPLQPEVRPAASAPFALPSLRGQPQATLDDEEQALIVAALAAAGSPDDAAVDRLFARRASLSPSARLLVAEAAQLQGGASDKRAVHIVDELIGAMVLDEATALVDDRESRHSWSSPVRTQAQLLGAMARMPSPSDMAPKVAQWLLDQRQDGRWSSTQENAWVLESLGRWLDRPGQVTTTQTVSVSLGDRDLGELTLDPRQLGGASLTVEQDQLPAGRTPLVFNRDGEGQMHYTIAYSWSPPAEAEFARNHGLFIRRVLLRRDGTRQPPSLLRGEEAVVAVVVVSDRRLRDVVVTEQLAAGLEAVQFGPSAVTPQQASVLQALADGRFFAPPGDAGESTYDVEAQATRVEYAGREVRWFFDELPAGIHVLAFPARAAVRGEFLGRGARATCMYRAEVWGSSDPYRLTIQ